MTVADQQAAGRDPGRLAALGGRRRDRLPDVRGRHREAAQRCDPALAHSRAGMVKVVPNAFRIATRADRAAGRRTHNNQELSWS
ncbi:hypothetical protein ACWD4L_33420 [Streptomyces sp. NPDC002596]|uniref:hypothetical protein n=1 Tax=Streptomyces sp. NPDC056227 TaxID=3345753 RepID=UPI0035DC1EC3